MRIIGGKHRGRVLATFAGMAIRPTADRVKESLFNILSTRIVGARVLDLFCGSGALGLESISRGASEVHFNDKSRESLAVLKSNLTLLKEQGKVTNLDFKSCLLNEREPFDFIFVDPPYHADYLADILTIVGERGLLKEEGVLIYESEESQTLSLDGWEKSDERKYGRTYLAFYRRTV